MRPVAKVAAVPARPAPPRPRPRARVRPPGSRCRAPRLARCHRARCRATARPGAPGKPGDRPRPKKGGRKSPLSQRRGPNGELFTPGDLLLPTGPQGPDEIQYLLRGAVAAEHAAGTVGRLRDHHQEGHAGRGR